MRGGGGASSWRDLAFRFFFGFFKMCFTDSQILSDNRGDVQNTHTKPLKINAADAFSRFGSSKHPSLVHLLNCIMVILLMLRGALRMWENHRSVCTRIPTSSISFETSYKPKPPVRKGPACETPPLAPLSPRPAWASIFNRFYGCLFCFVIVMV